MGRPEKEEFRLCTDDIAPRVESQRYRIFRVKDGGEPEIVGTCATREAVGVAICAWGEEEMFLDYCLGVMDALDRWEGLPEHEGDERYGHYVGKWLVLPWISKPTPEQGFDEAQP